MTPEQIKIYRNMSMARKFELIGQFNQAARELKAAGLRMQHPGWSEERIKARVAELFLYARG